MYVYKKKVNFKKKNAFNNFFNILKIKKNLNY